MKKFILIFFALAIFAPISVNAQSAAANKAWAPFLKQFRAAAVAKNRTAILTMALDGSRFETTAGGDTAADLVQSNRHYKDILSALNSGFTPWKGGKFTRKGCMWFKFIGNKWYWAGSPCD